MLLCIMLTYLMLFTALFNVVCLHSASLFCLLFCIAFMQMIFVLCIWFIDTVCLFEVLFCIMYSAFNLLVFPNSMFTPLLLLFERAMCYGKTALNNNNYYYYCTLLLITLLHYYCTLLLLYCIIPCMK